MPCGDNAPAQDTEEGPVCPLRVISGRQTGCPVHALSEKLPCRRAISPLVAGTGPAEGHSPSSARLPPTSILQGSRRRAESTYINRMVIGPDDDVILRSVTVTAWQAVEKSAGKSQNICDRAAAPGNDAQLVFRGELAVLMGCSKASSLPTARNPIARSTSSDA